MSGYTGYKFAAASSTFPVLLSNHGVRGSMGNGRQGVLLLIFGPALGRSHCGNTGTLARTPSASSWHVRACRFSKSDTDDKKVTFSLVVTTLTMQLVWPRLALVDFLDAYKNHTDTDLWQALPTFNDTLTNLSLKSRV